MKNKQPQNRPSLKESFRRFNIRLALTLSALIILFLAVFILLKNLDLYVVAVLLYSTITLVVALWYIIYNKGMVSGKVTPEMLPPEWSTEKKQALIDELAARRKKSKWALLILIPMIVVFGVEMLTLYVFPSLSVLLGALGISVVL